MHHDQDEPVVTLDGRFRVRLGAELTDAAPGTFVDIPRGTPNTWQSAGEGPARSFAAPVGARSHPARGRRRAAR